MCCALVWSRSAQGSLPTPISIFQITAVAGSTWSAWPHPSAAAARQRDTATLVGRRCRGPPRVPVDGHHSLPVRPKGHGHESPSANRSTKRGESTAVNAALPSRGVLGAGRMGSSGEPPGRSLPVEGGEDVYLHSLTAGSPKWKSRGMAGGVEWLVPTHRDGRGVCGVLPAGECYVYQGEKDTSRETPVTTIRVCAAIADPSTRRPPTGWTPDRPRHRLIGRGPRLHRAREHGRWGLLAGGGSGGEPLRRRAPTPGTSGGTGRRYWGRGGT